MTSEEALKALKNYHERNVNTEYMKMAIEALEKQIPKKFVLKTTNMGISTWGCPKCGSAIVPHPNVTWCDWCGQKIDMHKEVE